MYFKNTLSRHIIYKQEGVEIICPRRECKSLDWHHTIPSYHLQKSQDFSLQNWSCMPLSLGHQTYEQCLPDVDS